MHNLLKKRSRLRSLKRETNTAASTHMRHMPEDTLLPTWYQTITELPLTLFIDCAVDGNYKALVKTGNPDERLLYLAWLNIRSEYADAIGSKKHQIYVKLFRDVAVLSTTLEAVNQIIEILERVYSAELVTRLNSLIQARIEFDPKNPTRYKAALKSAIIRSRAIKISIEVKERQLQAMQSQQTGEDVKETREYYLSYLVTLSNHAKYNIDKNEITVFEYCERIKRFVQDCERLKRGKKHGR